VRTNNRPRAPTDTPPCVPGHRRRIEGVLVFWGACCSAFRSGWGPHCSRSGGSRLALHRPMLTIPKGCALVRVIVVHGEDVDNRDGRSDNHRRHPGGPAVGTREQLTGVQYRPVPAERGRGASPWAGCQAVRQPLRKLLKAESTAAAKSKPWRSASPNTSSAATSASTAQESSAAHRSEAGLPNNAIRAGQTVDHSAGTAAAGRARLGDPQRSPNERTPILTVLPPGQLSNCPLHLRLRLGGTPLGGGTPR